MCNPVERFSISLLAPRRSFEAIKVQQVLMLMSGNTRLGFRARLPPFSIFESIAEPMVQPRHGMQTPASTSAQLATCESKGEIFWKFSEQGMLSHCNVTVP